MTKTVKVDTWDIIERSSGYWLVGPSDPIGPFDTAEDAKDARYVSWRDIDGRIEDDDSYHESPWADCDGWEHEFISERFRDCGGLEHSQGWVGNYGNRGYIEVTDETVLTWGVGYTGCHKQVLAEAIAAKKREVLEQLVKWYTDGWEVYLAVAEYGIYTDCVGGLYEYDYAKELAEDCRHEIADQLEADGYIVTGLPKRKDSYNRIDAFRDRMKRNMEY